MLAPFLLMTLTRPSPCKINLLLNILGKRADGFHELETVMQPVGLCDELQFKRGGHGIQLTCSESSLPVDSTNLVRRAATAFLEAARIGGGVSIHLQKRIPLAAGLGGGSGNAANTLLGLNQLFGQPLTAVQLGELAAGLGSDVPFFLQDRPALATGRGAEIVPLGFFPALQGVCVFLVYPGFGIPTAWAYQELAKHPGALNGRPGRAQKLVAILQTADLEAAGKEFYNSLEAPALNKYPLLALFQEFLKANGAVAALMSGSGSTTFALVKGRNAGEELREKFRSGFGGACWTAVVPL
ncbi:MAG: 4-(cytidine 5'-diphospho)-2-C-methyl-D-erythritol kinase [Verrucomicrobia bacterium]|nr:MAG: 4-(cytidine 5'-diphospho)-2-C-methyl-D-erythritol kinase [Verrucomicrobiota bacterium]